MPSRAERAWKRYTDAVGPMVRPLAVHIVRGRVIDALGWWTLRQQYSRRELVELGVISRANSYTQDEHFEELFKRPVHEVTPQQFKDWVTALGADQQQQTEAEAEAGAAGPAPPSVLS
jgi:hypothetical protein